LKHVLLWFFLVLAAGIGLERSGLFPHPDPVLAASVCALALAAAWLTARHPRSSITFILAACLSLGIFLSASSPRVIFQKKWTDAIARTSGRPVALEGVMTEGRRSWRDGYGRDRYSFTLTLPEGGVRVFGVGPAVLPAYGDTVRVTGRIAVPGGRTNPAGFDWRNFLRTRGSYAVARADRFEVIGPPRGVSGAVYALRERLVRSMDGALGETASDISKAIFLGERSELEPDFRRALVNTGTLHLFAISGFNVGFVALVLFGALSFLRVPNPARSLIVLVLLIAYAVLVGDNSPVVRAVIMAGFLIAADLLKTRVSALQGLGAAGVLMLTMNPEEALDPAFQLSFAAVAGLALIVPLWGSIEDVRRARSDRWERRLWAWGTLTVLTSVAAWVTTVPILIHHFNRFSVVAPAVNVLLVPVAFLLNLLLMIFAFLACALPAAAGLFAWPIEVHVRALIRLVDIFDRLPGASWNLSSWHPLVWLVFAGWWAALGLVRKQVRRSLRVFLSVVMLFALIGADAARAHAAAPPLRATYLDVGQGNAAVVELGTARILIDAGRGGDADAAGRAILPFLAALGSSRIDAVFLTHPQFDHAGGLLRLLREADVGAVYVNGDRPDAAFYREILEEAGRREVPVFKLRRGDRLDGLPAGAAVRVLHPADHASGPGSDDLNERSLVLLLEALGKRLLWTGDIGEDGLADLLVSESFNRSVPGPAKGGGAEAGAIDVLQVPHHGSRTGINGGEFLDRVRPVTAVISCGRDNRYGHPHATTLEALGRAAESVHRTDLSGAFQFTAGRDGRASATDPAVV
jgi:competence protein ComEC